MSQYCPHPHCFMSKSASETVKERWHPGTFPLHQLAVCSEHTAEAVLWPWPAWRATCSWGHWAPWTAADGGSSWGRPRRRWPCWPRWRGPPWSRWGAAGRCAARSGCCTAPRRCFWSGCSSLCDTWSRFSANSAACPNGGGWSGVSLNGGNKRQHR